jgi:hypothetical protein
MVELVALCLVAWALSPEAVDMVEALGYIAAGLVAVSTITALLWSRRSPFRKAVSWLWHRNVGQPVSSAVRAWLDEVIDERIVPRLDQLEEKNDRQHAEVAKRVAFLGSEISSVKDAVAAVNDKLDTHLARNTGETPLTVRSVTTTEVKRETTS